MAITRLGFAAWFSAYFGFTDKDAGIVYTVSTARVTTLDAHQVRTLG